MSIICTFSVIPTSLSSLHVVTLVTIIIYRLRVFVPIYVFVIVVFFFSISCMKHGYQPKGD